MKPEYAIVKPESLAAIVKEAESAFPAECCGLLLGERAPHGFAIEGRLERVERFHFHARDSEAGSTAGSSTTIVRSVEDSNWNVCTNPAAQTSVLMPSTSAMSPCGTPSARL